MRIFEQIFLQTRQKFAGILGVWQEFLTQYAAKFAEKTQADAYAFKFLQRTSRLFPLREIFQAIPHKDCATDASSDFLRDEGKNGENPLWIFEYFPEISRKICTQDACGKIRNRL